jgi:hypothetical protein
VAGFRMMVAPDSCRPYVRLEARSDRTTTRERPHTAPEPARAGSGAMKAMGDVASGGAGASIDSHSLPIRRSGGNGGPHEGDKSIASRARTVANLWLSPVEVEIVGPAQFRLEQAQVELVELTKAAPNLAPLDLLSSATSISTCFCYQDTGALADRAGTPCLRT